MTWAQIHLVDDMLHGDLPIENLWGAVHLPVYDEAAGKNNDCE